LKLEDHIKDLKEKLEDQHKKVMDNLSAILQNASLNDLKQNLL